MYNQTLKHGLKVVMTTKSVEVFNISSGEKYEDKNNKSGLIKLHGAIHVKLFAFLCEEKDGIKPFAEADFKKDEITWISPTLNQTHQLVNNGKPTCKI